MAQNKWLLPAVVIGGLSGLLWFTMKKAKITRVIDILAKPDSYIGKTVTVEGMLGVYGLAIAIADESSGELSLAVDPMRNIEGCVGKRVRITGVVFMWEAPPIPHLVPTKDAVLI